MIIKYSRDAIEFLEKQEKRTVDRIRAAISKLTLNPPEGDIALLQGYADNRMGLRTGSWRIIFKYAKEDMIEILLIIDIGSRGDIYK